MKPNTVKMKCTIMYNVKPENVYLSMFCVNLTPIGIVFKNYLLIIMSSNGLTFDFIGLTKVF